MLITKIVKKFMENSFITEKYIFMNALKVS